MLCVRYIISYVCRLKKLSQITAARTIEFKIAFDYCRSPVKFRKHHLIIYAVQSQVITRYNSDAQKQDVVSYFVDDIFISPYYSRRGKFVYTS